MRGLPAVFGEPLLAHRAEIGGVHASWCQHSWDNHNRDQHDDDANDEQHMSFAVIGSSHSVGTILALLRSTVCAVVHNPPSPWTLCAVGDSTIQRWPVRLDHATRIAQSHRRRCLDVGGVYRWHRRTPELTVELDRSRQCRPSPDDRHDVAVERSSPKPLGEHSGGTPITTHVAVAPEAEAGIP